MWKNGWWYYMKVQTVSEKKNCSSNPSFPTIEIPCNQRSLTWAFSRPSHLHWGSNFTILPFDSKKIVNKQLKMFFNMIFFRTSNRLKPVHLFVIKLEHSIPGFEQMDIKHSSTQPITIFKWDIQFWSRVEKCVTLPISFLSLVQDTFVMQSHITLSN